MNPNQSSVFQTSMLVQRAVEGDRGSLERVVAHLSPLVEAQVRFRLGSLARNQADVEDLVADVWAVVFQRLHELRPREGHYAPVLTKYLGTTASHHCNNFLRAKARRRATSLAESAESGERAREPAGAAVHETRSIVTQVFHTEVIGLVRRALGELGEEKRRVLVLRLLEHKTNLEIAELLEMEPNTVAVRYRRALDELRERLPASVFSELWGFRSAPGDTGP